MEFKKQLIKDTEFKNGTNNGRKHIVLHQTGNKDKGADAQAHADLQTKGNVRNAAWHYSVDDKESIQSFDHKFELWQAGDGEFGTGNNNGISVEICINSDGDYKKAVQNAAKLVQRIMKEENIRIQEVKQHHAFSGKNCPAQIRAGVEGITWADFIRLVKDIELPAPKPYKPNAQDTNSIVTYLLQNGKDASFPARAKLADKHGINGYRGTAAQNIQLLTILRSGKQPKKPEYKGMNEVSIVRFMDLNKMDSSFGNRAKLARKFGIANYRGTATQNKKLLELIKQ